jgi:hypothetical protein
MAVSLTLDKTTQYAPGDKGVLTVVDDARVHADTITVTDSAGGVLATTPLNLLDPAPTVKDTKGRVYTLLSDDKVKTSTYSFTA